MYWVTLSWFPLRKILLWIGSDRKISFVRKFSGRTNGFSTKEAFLSVPVLRRTFLSGNQPSARIDCATNDSAYEIVRSELCLQEASAKFTVYASAKFTVYASATLALSLRFQSIPLIVYDTTLHRNCAKRWSNYWAIELTSTGGEF